ncbi:porin family protein [Paraflavitalea sp. CAU 1676]|uniref:porin family protein n=1 Tax=Paraflavitalea sp. CAU 1676 TaxID=3032598 RepID=UPI0023DBC96D|nr:porin family protein [Paraflavitalea sp. CAU 1676]MDF2191930.1 porin family protein [Paraflavitalea sp. CAU 1676]
MYKLLSALIFALPLAAAAQSPQPEQPSPRTKFGLKAGLNFSNITKVSSVNGQSRNGFMVGAFLAPPSKGILGYRSEIVFSRQGYDYKTSSTTGSVHLDYILLPQLMCINITKFVQLQAGGQVAFLVSGKVDSSASSYSRPNTPGKMIDYYNRFDYGIAGGLEVYPFKGLLIGARFNMSLATLNKEAIMTNPNYVPRVDAKNNVFSLFAGYKF